MLHINPTNLTFERKPYSFVHQERINSGFVIDNVYIHMFLPNSTLHILLLLIAMARILEPIKYASKCSL